MKKATIVFVMFVISLLGASVAAAPDEYTPCLTPDGRYAYLDVQSNPEHREDIVKFVNVQGDIIIDVFKHGQPFSHTVLSYDLCGWNN